MVRIQHTRHRIDREKARVAHANVFHLHPVQTIRDINVAYSKQFAGPPPAQYPERPGRRKVAQGQLTIERRLEAADNHLANGSKSIIL